MEKTKNVKTQATPNTAKLPYEAPKANFVPLQVEERLLACEKSPVVTCAPQFS